MTLMNLILWIVTIDGVALGWIFGKRMEGIPGALIGSVFGLYLGWRIGRLPVVFWRSSVQRAMRRANDADLYTMLDQEQYMKSHLVIAELIRRGEPPEAFRGFIERELASSDPRARNFGRLNARTWHPESLKAQDAASVSESTRRKNAS